MQTSTPERRFRVWRLAIGLGLLSCPTLGCGKKEKPAPAAQPEMEVKVITPERRNIERSVGQPAFINAYEQTAIYPKIAGYVNEWTVDIGDHIHKDQELATLFVPELNAEYEEKKADVVRDRVLIDVAPQLVDVARNQLGVAAADVAEAKSDVHKFESAVDRWESEVRRLTKLTEGRGAVIDKQVLDESQKQLKSNIAERDAAQSAVLAAQATQAARGADLKKAVVDVEAARAKTKVAEAIEARYAALLSYTKLTAPYDGIVVVRNVNTGDFVQPATGDKTNDRDTIGPGAGTRSPMYVVARTDIVRVFVDVPEMDANHVTEGTEARVQVQALDDAEIRGAVTRTSWALNVQTRTLRAEIDLKNPGAKLLPGMYAYAEVLIHRKNVMALPLAAIVQKGNQNCCYLLEGNKAIQVPVETGTDDGKWIEAPKKKIRGHWVPLDGTEQVILGDLAELSDGEEVEVKKPKHDSRSSSDEDGESQPKPTASGDAR